MSVHTENNSCDILNKCTVEQVFSQRGPTTDAVTAAHLLIIYHRLIVMTTIK